jgi:hypothetical protein
MYVVEHWMVGEQMVENQHLVVEVEGVTTSK